MSENKKTPLLEVQDIHVYYGAIHAIKGISFHVDQDEIVTLIGANGAGKSTTLNTITGLLRPKHGSIYFRGENVTTTPSHKMSSRGIALCPEGRRIFQQMTVRENLEMGGYTRQSGEIAESMEEMFTRFPASEGKRKADRRHAFGRRAADAGHGKSPDEQAEGAHAG